MSVHADRAREQDEARQAVERGEALPLAELLGRVRAELGGELVGVSFERKRGRWIYEFKVVGERGQIEEVYVDAATAEILKREGR
ncbi:PepSY domain-containing protein [Alsobacter sp. KACC 23698]|uniref:PepSY domain-containing protein n=1 Tax=Alsobacter sp. KACC 23698 TaxID=3149229 RepID=A0AAU7JFV2_9HYPH